MYRHLAIAASFALLLAACASAPSADGVAPFSERADVQSFIDDMVQRHGFDREQLRAWLDKVEIRNDIIEAISRPAEAKPWYEYRPIFLQRARIDGGADFWGRHAEALQRAEERYGVPAEIITAIIGVETRYGSHKGRYRVMDALATLGFQYPPRAKFFRSELEHYLLLTREEGIEPFEMKGSYAGAMGQPQFISSSFRHYAIDFDGDGRRDLWDNPTDAIGSVANYLKENGWERGGGIAVPAAASGDVEALLKDGVKPARPLKELKARGVTTAVALDDAKPAALIAFQQEDGPEYWLGLQNFYVITRYNRSPLYAMAVYQLSEEIRAQRKQRASQPVS